MSEEARLRRINYLRCVDKKAEALKREGYDVEAIVDGYDSPDTIDGLIPDLRAERGNNVFIGQMLSDEDLGNVDAEYKKLIKYAEKNEGVSFRVYQSLENGESKLYKIFK
jgi:hypothetical protein